MFIWIDALATARTAALHMTSSTLSWRRKMSRAFLLFLFALAVAVSCSLAAPSDVEKRSVLYSYGYRYPYDVSYYYDGAYDYLPYQYII
ncbi:hypothetical protein evm_000410 [Chilo suppressalis]|nr:hypothetical protein evm_000410 [Chilo suppressalis]